MKFNRPRLLFAKYAELFEEDCAHPRLSRIQKELESFGYEINIVDDEEPPFLEDGEGETMRDPKTCELLKRQLANIFLHRIGNRGWTDFISIEYWTPMEYPCAAATEGDQDDSVATFTSYDREFLAGKISCNS